MSVKTLPEAILFDLDGTLFRTETLSIPAYHATFDQMRREGSYHGDTPSEDIFLGSLGLLLKEIWARVLPTSSMETRARADELLIEHQLRLLREGYGEMYPGVEETLLQLKEAGIRLFVASNGLEDYVKQVIHAKGMDHFFDGMYSAGEYQTASKVDLVRILLEKHDVQTAWMCGDRKSDVEAGRKNELYTVYCNYGGFNDVAEADGADVVIHEFVELRALL